MEVVFEAVVSPVAAVAIPTVDQACFVVAVNYEQAAVLVIRYLDERQAAVFVRVRQTVTTASKQFEYVQFQKEFREL